MNYAKSVNVSTSNGGKTRTSTGELGPAPYRPQEEPSGRTSFTSSRSGDMFTTSAMSCPPDFRQPTITRGSLTVNGRVTPAVDASAP